MSLLALINPAGGIPYHLRALFKADSLWGETRKWVSRNTRNWLERTPQTPVTLISPSGGYLFSPDLFRGTKEVEAFDVDPLAPTLFSLRHGRKPAWTSGDLFFREGKLSIEAMRNLLSARPHNRFIFCNILGQIPHLLAAKGFAQESSSLSAGSLSASSLSDWYKDFSLLLGDRHFLSFHERMSFCSTADRGFLETEDVFLKRLTTDEIVKRLAVQNPAKGLAVKDAKNLDQFEVINHETDLLDVRFQACRYHTWKFSENETHLLEMLHSPLDSLTQK